MEAEYESFSFLERKSEFKRNFGIGYAVWSLIRRLKSWLYF